MGNNVSDWTPHCRVAVPDPVPDLPPGVSESMVIVSINVIDIAPIHRPPVIEVTEEEDKIGEDEEYDETSNLANNGPSTSYGAADDHAARAHRFVYAFETG